MMWGRIDTSYVELKEFLNNVGSLHSITLNFLRYYDDIIKQASERKVHELSENIKGMVLGGINSNGEYSENAYSLFIKDFLGLYIENPKLYVAKLKLEEKPDVKVIAEESMFIKFTKLLNRISGFIIDKAAKELDIVIKGIKEERINEYNVEDLIGELIKKSYNLSVGINRFSTTVWSLRKITPHFLKKAYGEIKEDLLELLGLSELIKMKNYEIWGFSDYFTKCMLYDTSSVGGGPQLIIINGVPIVSNLAIVRKYLDKYHVDSIAPETLGGAICMLNEIIWRYIKLLGDRISRWFNGYVDVEKVYIKNAWNSLDNIGWSIPQYIEKERAYAEFNKLLEGVVGSSHGSPFKFLVYEDGIISKYIQWIYGGSYARSEFEEYRLSDYITLPQLFDDLMPAIFLGAIDITLYLKDRKALLILVRMDHGE